MSELVERTLTDVASVKTPIIRDVWSCFWKNLFFAQITSFGCFQSRGSLSNQLLNKLGRHTEKEEEEIMRQMKYLEGCLGETRRRSTEPRLTLVSFKICSKLSLNTLDNHFIPFLTGQQSSQLRSMPKNCAFYTNDGNLR